MTAARLADTRIPQEPLSNRLADLAERIGDAWRRHRAASLEAAEAYLQAGTLLIEAKGECKHGEWLPVLSRAGIPERTAHRAMRLARSHMTAGDIAAAGGVKAALQSLTEQRKSVTVTDFEQPEQPKLPERAPLSPALRQRRLRQTRRDAGLCLDCGSPADSHSRCEECRTRIARRGRRRRALARVGEALTPRLVEAARSGHGMALSADEVASLAKHGTPGN